MLEYSNTKKAIIDHIDTEDVITYKQVNENGVEIRYPGKIQPHTKLINEYGLYSLILRSKNKKAKLIKRWITSEVMPSIKKCKKQIHTTNGSNNIFNKSLLVSDGSFIKIPIREDGYINATALCKAGGKQWKNYFQNDQTKLYIEAFNTSVGIPADVFNSN